MDLEFFKEPKQDDSNSMVMVLEVDRKMTRTGKRCRNFLHHLECRKQKKENMCSLSSWKTQLRNLYTGFKIIAPN